MSGQEARSAAKSPVAGERAGAATSARSTKHADRIRFVLMHQWADADKRMRALSSLWALEAEIDRLQGAES